MDLSFVAVQALNGLASASSLFITACGLTLVFGVTRIVNFAHGSLYMVGAYHGRDPGAVAARIVVRAGLVLGRHPALGAHRRRDRNPHRGAAAPAHLRRAGIVPASGDLRRRAGAAGSRRAGFRPAGHPRTARAGPARPGRDLRTAVSVLRAGADRRRSRGARARVAAAAPDPLRHPRPRRDAGPRHGGGAWRQPGAALHRHAVRRRLPRRARRRAADPARRRQYGHGSLDHRRMLRRHGGGRHGQRAGRLSGGLDHRAIAGLRHSGLPEKHAGGRLPADGRGARRQALRLLRAPRDRRRHARGRYREPQSDARRKPVRAVGAARAPGLPAAGRRMPIC